ncbi:ABC transporter ATP-binding protein [Bradyrhizobium sp.]|uniref:ABC transporter ATP-binding protein n=1 Tax=Bradyrhizobium sp. TaxID=376 RepID=UPI0039E5A4E6
MSAERGLRLELADVGRRFGGVAAIRDVSLSIPEGQITGIIGPNGAGKTTLFNLVTGSLRPTSGRILLNGRRIDGRDPGDISRLGLVRSFQSPSILPGLSVADHLRCAVLCQSVGRPRRLLADMLKRSTRCDTGAVVDEILEFAGLGAYADQEAGALAYGLQKTLGLAAALAASPKLLLADEPAAGLNGAETRRMEELLRAIRDKRGVSLVVIEHDVPLMMRLCERIIVLAEGSVIVDGPPGSIRHAPAFIDAYLGPASHAT